MNLKSQLFLFLTSIQIGVVLAVVYDFIIFIRKIIKHPNWVIQLEDFLFFLFGGILTFIFIYQKNYGEIRPFIFIGILIGLVLYFAIASKYIQFFLNFVFKPFKCIIDSLRKTYSQIELIIKK